MLLSIWTLEYIWRLWSFHLTIPVVLQAPKKPCKVEIEKVSQKDFKVWWLLGHSGPFVPLVNLSTLRWSCWKNSSKGAQRKKNHRLGCQYLSSSAMDLTKKDTVKGVTSALWSNRQDFLQNVEIAFSAVLQGHKFKTLQALQKHFLTSL